MNKRLTIRIGHRLGPEDIRVAGSRWTVIGAIVVVSVVTLVAQSAELQQKLEAVKQSVEQNQQRLHQYQWTETTQLTLKGDPKSPSSSICQYGPGGQVQKTPISPPHHLRVAAE
jgi:hypothetical protein